jgi:predicted nucleic acid-binding Zn ribbon protein
MVDIPKEIPEHKHCMICGKSISVEREFCSEDCQEQYNGIMKKRKRSNYIMIIVMVILLAVLFIPMLLQG